MTNRRHDKFARLIQKEMGTIFLTSAKKYFGNAMISVTHVMVSPDLSYAKIFLNFVNVADPINMIELVKIHARELRMELGSKIRNQVRKIPELNFFYDESFDYVEKMEKIFSNLTISEEEE